MAIKFRGKWTKVKDTEFKIYTLDNKAYTKPKADKSRKKVGGGYFSSKSFNKKRNLIIYEIVGYDHGSSPQLVYMAPSTGEEQDINTVPFLYARNEIQGEIEFPNLSYLNLEQLKVVPVLVYPDEVSRQEHPADPKTGFIPQNVYDFSELYEYDHFWRKMNNGDNLKGMIYQFHLLIDLDDRYFDPEDQEFIVRFFILVMGYNNQIMLELQHNLE